MLLMHIEHLGKFHQLLLQPNSGTLPRDGDALLLKRRSKEGRELPRGIGIVVKSDHSENKQSIVRVRVSAKSKFADSLVLRSHCDVWSLTSLVTCSREYQALRSVRHSSFSDFILRPKRTGQAERTACRIHACTCTNACMNVSSNVRTHARTHARMHVF